MINELSDTEMQKIHKIVLAMLKDFDAICSRNRINYFLGGGTLLGANGIKIFQHSKKNFMDFLHFSI